VIKTGVGMVLRLKGQDESGTALAVSRGMVVRLQGRMNQAQHWLYLEEW